MDNQNNVNNLTQPQESASFCSNCGERVAPGVKFCDKCGASQNSQYNAPVQPADYQNQNQQQQKPKKPIYKKWWFWLIIVIVFLCIIGAISGNSGNDIEDTPAQNATTSAEENTTAEKTTAETTTEKPTEDPAKTESEFKDSCDTIDFETLSRNPDKYKGNNYKLTGEVIQVQESSWSDKVDLRINITKEEYEYIDDVLWTDTIYATVEVPEGEDKILEDDIITFWGTCEGNYSYTSVLGNSVSLPKIDIKYYELSE